MNLIKRSAGAVMHLQMNWLESRRIRRETDVVTRQLREKASGELEKVHTQIWGRWDVEFTDMDNELEEPDEPGIQ